MKKIIIAMIAVIIGLSSCSKEQQLLGSWELETIEMHGVTLNASEAEISIILTFKDGNTLEFSSNGYSESISYTIKDNKIIVDGEEMEFELKGKKLIIKGVTFEIGDSNGSQATLTFKRR